MTVTDSLKAEHLQKNDEKAIAKCIILGEDNRGYISAVLSPDGKKIVTTYSESENEENDDIAHIWDAESGRELLKLEGHTDDVCAAAFSPDGKIIATGSYDEYVCIWDAESGKKLLELEGHKDDVYSATFFPDGKKILTESGDGTARIWTLL